MIPIGPFRRFPLAKPGKKIAVPDFANLLWRYESEDIPVGAAGSDITDWPDRGPYAADIVWPGPGFVFVPPYPFYTPNYFGSKPAAYNEYDPGNNQPCGGQLPFNSGAVLGTSYSMYLYGEIPDQQDAPALGSIGVLLDYPNLLNTANWNFVLPYVGGSGSSLDIGFAYNFNSLATGTVLVDVAVRTPGRHVYAWVFDKATTITTIYEDGVVLGASAAIPDMAAGPDFGPDDGGGESSTIFSDHAGNDAILE